MSEPDPQPPKNRRLNRRRPPKGRLRVICQRGALELGPNLAVAVLDLSESGVRLVVKEALVPGREVSISMEGPGGVRPVKRVGTVAWSVPSPDGTQFWAGVHFEKRLEYRDFLSLT